MEKLLQQISDELIANVKVESVHFMEPVRVKNAPQPWILLGAGNYAAVFYHPDYEDYAVKVYAIGKSGLKEEAEVYEKLGVHPAYSACYYVGENFLVLKRLRGVTVYECMKRGILVSQQAIEDIDAALDYARSKGLRPHDIHGKNVMVEHGRGLIVDISDFYKQEECKMWGDFKKAYYRLYLPVASRLLFPVPGVMLEGVRKGYQVYRKRKKAQLTRH